MKQFLAVFIAAILAVGFGWVALPYAKGKAPHAFGYASLGWVRGGVGTTYGVSTPRWHGWAGFRAAAGAPFNHHKVWLNAGQTIELEYEILAERGGLSVSIYRTRLSRVLQGSMVEDHDYLWLRSDDFSGIKTYTAENDGWHKITYDILWEPDSHDEVTANPYTVLVPDFELRYDLKWRIVQDDYAELG
ncbi:MAG: hypothetical protein AAF437_01240 [Pseudomonadota bacterium]